MDKRKLFFRSIVAIVVIGALYRYFSSQPAERLTHISGKTMGTITYNVKYIDKTEPVSKSKIDSVLRAFNQSLSTYIPDSEISILNQSGELNSPSRLFTDVMQESYRVYEMTSGAYDPTVGTLVNVWGFGPDKSRLVPDSTLVDSLRQFVGLQKIVLEKEAINMDTLMYLDFSAIAKGYAVDLVSELLLEHGVNSYMVEIGGEVRTHGVNDQGKTWTIGIEDPLVEREEQRLLGIVRLNNMAMATSGNYRSYYEVGDRIIAHTIDPRTGYNTTHNLLSASVFSNGCMTADAMATAFMVLGLEGSMRIVESTEVEAFLIFQKEDGSLASYVSDGLKPYIDLDKTQNQ
ncbi:MAG: FAD:protein FMN transferase [Cyclobacteriaceae bacterium]